MIRVRDVARIVERAAPPVLALPDDNPGLQVGDPDAPVRGILVALDASPAAVARAAAAKANLLLTHHPLLFEGVRSLDTRSWRGAAVAAAAAHGVAVFSAHTNLDAAPGGLGVAVARRLGLEGVEFLHPVPGPARFKVAVYVPPGAVRAVRDAMASAGAGRIGRYEGCAFLGPGEGVFRALRGAHPAVGRVGRLERVPETRLEMVADGDALAGVVAACRREHPYEEPAIDVFPLRAGTGGGYGCIGRVPAAPLAAFARRAARLLGAEARLSGASPARVRTVALCPGSGGRLVETAARAGADVFVTGEVRYHVMREAGHLGIALLELGHDRTEMPAVDLLAAIVREGLGGAGRPRVTIGIYREPRASRTLAAGRRKRG